MKKDTGEKVVKTFAVISWIEAAVLLLGALGLFALGPALGNLYQGATGNIASGVGIGAAALLVVMAALYILNGFGLWRFQNWGRIMTIVLGVLSLFAFPIGTVIGIITIWLFAFSDGVKTSFHHARAH